MSLKTSINIFRHRGGEQARPHLPYDCLLQGTLQDCQVRSRFSFVFVCLFIFAFVFDHNLFSRYLIDIGADVNRKSVKGNTALHDCAESGSLEIMKLLIGSGAR